MANNYWRNKLTLGNFKNEKIIEVGVIAENKGYVEQKFTHIGLKIYGLDKKSELHELKGHKPRLEFPLKLHDTNLISKKNNYYFVRPKVKQRFPITLTIAAASISGERFRICFSPRTAQI